MSFVSTRGEAKDAVAERNTCICSSLLDSQKVQVQILELWAQIVQLALEACRPLSQWKDITSGNADGEVSHWGFKSGLLSRSWRRLWRQSWWVHRKSCASERRDACLLVKKHPEVRYEWSPCGQRKLGPLQIKTISAFTLGSPVAELIIRVSELIIRVSSMSRHMIQDEVTRCKCRFKQLCTASKGLKRHVTAKWSNVSFGLLECQQWVAAEQCRNIGVLPDAPDHRPC